MRTGGGGRRRGLLVCSPGGHLAQMLALEPCWRDLDATWVTLPGPDADDLRDEHEVVFGHGPTNRSVVKLARNLLVAWREIRRRRPDVIVSTGAALAVPFFVIGRLHGCKLVYVESLTRTQGLSLTGRLVYPLATEFFVQWPQAAAGRPRAKHVGDLLDLCHAGHAPSAVPAADGRPLQPVA